MLCFACVGFAFSSFKGRSSVFCKVAGALLPLPLSLFQPLPDFLSRPGQGVRRCPVRLWTLILYWLYLLTAASRLCLSFRLRRGEFCGAGLFFIPSLVRHGRWGGVPDAVEATGAAGSLRAAHTSVLLWAPQRHTQPGLQEPPPTEAP